MMKCNECGRIFDEDDFGYCPDCMSTDLQSYSEDGDKYEEFKSQLRYDLRNYEWTNADSNHPTCPDCGNTMNFYGHDESGDFPIGEGYWECSSCGYKVTENDI